MHWSGSIWVCGAAHRTSGDDFKEVKKDKDVEGDAYGCQAESGQGNKVDFLADAPQVFNQLLLSAGIAVGGLANPAQMIVYLVQSRSLLCNLVAELVLQSLDLGQFVFNGGQIDRLRQRRLGDSGLRNQSEGNRLVGDRHAGILVEQGKKGLNGRQSNAKHVHGASRACGKYERKFLHGVDRNKA